MSNYFKLPKVFVIGAGMVGSTTAYALLTKEVVSEIVMIDIAEDLLKGQVMDMHHASACTSGVSIRAGSYEDIEENDIVVITCGAAQKPGQTRLELLEINTKIIKDVVGKVMQNGKPVYMIMVTNPVDVMTYVALKESGLESSRVFGTGTSLDSARLRINLADKLEVSPRDVCAYIIGEHGDSSFPALSTTTIGGIELKNFPGYKDEMVANIKEEIRDAAYKIIESKKATYNGIASVVTEIVSSLVRDENKVYPVCRLVEGEYGLNDLAIGLPSVINHKGATVVNGLSLDSGERELLQVSSEVIKSALASIGY